MRIKLAALIVAVVFVVIAFSAYFVYNGDNPNMSNINNEVIPYGSANDLEIQLGNDDICVTAMKNTVKSRMEAGIAITISNPTDKRVKLDNVTISVIVDKEFGCNIDISYPSGYGMVTYHGSFSKKVSTLFGTNSMPPNAVISTRLLFSIVDWNITMKPVYDNYIEINGIRHNFVVDPDDFEISFDTYFDFSNVVNNGIVTHNKTITHTLTIYNPTYMNSTQFWLTLGKLDSLENDKFVVKAGYTFLYWNEEYNNMLIKELPSFNKIDIPISIAFVKGQPSRSYDCELIIFSGRCYSIPITLAMGV